jgi:dihydroorotate dehydrogenase (fumarate)
MTDLATRYLGLDLRSPLVASASPLSATADGVRRLADGGAAAVVLPSLFEEQLRQQAERDAVVADAGAESFAESLSYFPAAVSADGGPRRYLSLLKRAAAAVDIPVIASLNGASTGGWTDCASALQDAGAAAIELNIYYLPGTGPSPARRAMPSSPSPFISGSEVEQRHVEILSTVKAVVGIPVAVKLSPYFSSTGEMAGRLDRAGADGLVLFNRFLQPDIDPETLAVTVRPGLSTQAEGRLPRAWIALLAGRVRASLAATTGVETAADVARYLLAGADVVMTASALLRHGPGYAAVLLGELSDWMARKGFGSVAEARGLLAVPDGTDQAAYERAGYVTALEEANRGYGPW